MVNIDYYSRLVELLIQIALIAFAYCKFIMNNSSIIPIPSHHTTSKTSELSSIFNVKQQLNVMQPLHEMNVACFYSVQ